MSKTNLGLLAIAPLAALPALGQARGVTPYLPLNLDPETERQIERVLILGDKTTLRRPIPAALVIEALPKACERDAVLCAHVQKYLERYMKDTGIEFLSVAASASTGKGNPVMPNEHGQTEQSHYQVSGAAYVQPSDYALVNVGAVAYQGNVPVTPTGSFLSLGFDWAQLDLGYRDRWWSPMSDDSMLISTEAPTMPSVTLSNYRPLTSAGIEYELFVARMSYSHNIEPAIQPTPGTLTFTSGYPKMAGVHLGIAPANTGWSLGVNRVLIYGGGAAGGESVGDILKAFFDPAKAQTSGFSKGNRVIGKQEASLVSQFIVPARIPFSLYMEYSGNDTSDGKNFLFGKPDLSVGIHIPRLGPFDITFENQRWAPTWYSHGVLLGLQTGYLDGITNYMRSIGNWFGDQRGSINDAVGGQSDMLRVGWEPSFGGLMELTGRVLVNDSLYVNGLFSYHHEYMGSLSYSYPLHGYVVGGQIDAGQDVLGQHYARLQGFLRLGDALRSGYPESDDDTLNAHSAPGTEVFVDVGANTNRILENILQNEPEAYTEKAFGPHLAVGARREVTTHQDLGMRVEADDIQGRLFLAVRALDYRFRFNNPLALNLFAGAARYSLATPAFGWYLGGGPQWRNILPGWDLGADYRYGIKVARLRELPTDPAPLAANRPDSFYDITSLSLYVSHKF